jgi:hypothetical protein
MYYQPAAVTIEDHRQIGDKKLGPYDRVCKWVPGVPECYIGWGNRGSRYCESQETSRCIGAARVCYQCDQRS